MGIFYPRNESGPAPRHPGPPPNPSVRPPDAPPKKPKKAKKRHNPFEGQYIIKDGKRVPRTPTNSVPGP